MLGGWPPSPVTCISANCPVSQRFKGHSFSTCISPLPVPTPLPAPALVQPPSCGCRFPNSSGSCPLCLCVLPALHSRLPGTCPTLQSRRATLGGGDLLVSRSVSRNSRLPPALTRSADASGGVWWAQPHLAAGFPLFAPGDFPLPPHCSVLPETAVCLDCLVPGGLPWPSRAGDGAPVTGFYSPMHLPSVAPCTVIEGVFGECSPLPGDLLGLCALHY